MEVTGSSPVSPTNIKDQYLLVFYIGSTVVRTVRRSRGSTARSKHRNLDFEHVPQLVAKRNRLSPIFHTHFVPKLTPIFIPLKVLRALTSLPFYVSITGLNGRHSALSTNGSLESFKLFYEELTSSKPVSRIRRVRPAAAASE